MPVPATPVELTESAFIMATAGRLTQADVITPTAQNLANIEKDLRVTAQNLAGRPKDDLGTKLEMVVRAYDPCISCAVHLVEVYLGQRSTCDRQNKPIAG